MAVEITQGIGPVDRLVQCGRCRPVSGTSQEIIRGDPIEIREAAKGIQVRGMDAVLIVGNGPDGDIEVEGKFLLAYAPFFTEHFQGFSKIHVSTSL